MLILTRRPEETLVIDKSIRVRVMSVNGNQVRIGIDAPKNIEVDREEIFLAKQKGRKVANVPA
jgi:carbon storage regulator